ncbi:glycerol-3-phosphate 1-O-acyltransferase PlsY [Chloroflexota bacterium]
MVIWFIPLIISAYLLGSVPTAYLVSKWRRGIDIREYGSGNVGASNVLTVVSKRWSIAVTIFDVGKGALTVWIVQLLGLGASQQAVTGIATIIGHNWPVFLRFQGGRGILTSLGVITMLSPWLGLIALAITYLFAPFKQISLGVTVGLIILPVLSWLLSQPLGIKEPLPITLGFTAILLIALFRRLTVPRSQISASVSTGELIVNRLLFDRDIRDRDTWIHQSRLAADQLETQHGQEEQGASS